MKKFEIIAQWITLIVGAISAIYVGGWLMFIQPIIEACNHFDAGTLTGAIIGATILKCIFSGTVGLLVYYACVAIYALIIALIKTTAAMSKLNKGGKNECK